MPDHHIWIHYSRPRTRWYELSPDERATRVATWRQAVEKSERDGGRRMGTYHVRGQSDYERVEVWQFPDVDAAFTHWARLTEAGYAELFASANNIGVSCEDVMP